MNETCKWMEDEFEDWETDCDNTHTFFYLDETPGKALFKFCPFCGRKIHAVEYEDER